MGTFKRKIRVNCYMKDIEALYKEFAYQDLSTSASFLDSSLSW
jgi:hypothetical protein